MPAGGGRSVGVRAARQDAVEAEETTRAVGRKIVLLSDLVAEPVLEGVPSEHGVKVHQRVELVDVAARSHAARSEIIDVARHFEAGEGGVGNRTGEALWKPEGGDIESFPVHQVGFVV